MSIQIKKHIPNAVTCLNLLAGCVAIVADLYWQMPNVAVLAIVAAAVFDLFDGMLARALKVSSNIGADLDSLADVVSFGVAPSIHLFAMLNRFESLSPVCTLPAFFIAAFAAIRLAKFNNDTRQSESFIGLPVPANALFWISFVALIEPLPLVWWQMLLLSYAFVLLFSYLMVCELPMLSFKVHSLAWRGNELRYILVLASLLFLFLFQMGGFAPAILLYVVLALFANRVQRIHS